MRWAGNVARIGATRNAYRIMMVKPEGKGQLVKASSKITELKQFR
jgi:hypothetical protein